MKLLRRLILLTFIFIGIALGPSIAYAADVQMGYDGNLVFEPSEITINAGESVHFVNNMLPPHNVVVEGHDEAFSRSISNDAGEEFDVAFPESGDYTFWCGLIKEQV